MCEPLMMCGSQAVGGGFQTMWIRHVGRFLLCSRVLDVCCPVVLLACPCCLLCCFYCRLHHPVSAPKWEPGSGGFLITACIGKLLRSGSSKVHTGHNGSGLVAEHSDGSNDGTVFTLRPPYGVLVITLIVGAQAQG